MTHRALWTWVAASSLACNATKTAPPGATTSEAPATPGAVAEAGVGFISLQRTTCLGYCPSYKVTVHEDGLIEYEGDQYVRTHGKTTWRVPPADAQALFARFAAEHFDTMTMPKQCTVITTDSPTATTTMDYGGRRHRVVRYGGNTCAPKALAGLEKAVDDAAKTASVIACPPRPFCDKP